MFKSDFAIVGGGLAGCECAAILGRSGYRTTIFEQRPEYHSEAHKGGDLAELVCSNSLRSDDPQSAIGLLHAEMRALGSLIMACADEARVPADQALAVDREKFSRLVTAKIEQNPDIKLVRRRIDSLRDEALRECGNRGVIICAGPLASAGLSRSLAELIGRDYCYFYDAIAPIVWTDSLDMDVIFRASRHSEAEGDYLNCPMSRDEYERFHQALLEGETFKAHACEKERHFGGCMPIEAIAATGSRSLVFGPLKPVGLTDPRTGRRPYAVLQLRPENIAFATCNLVGCQTKLLQGEQARIFRLIPGLQNAEFCRYGSMHRNTFVNAPETLNRDLSLKADARIYLAGQITGVEGYVESAACGLWLGLMLAAKEQGRALSEPPRETALGALLGHLQRPDRNFQPSNVNFGLMPPLEQRANKKERKRLYGERARRSFAAWVRENRL